MKQIELVPFIPETASYRIWHPKEFIVNESEDNIVSITSPHTDSNLTLSGYRADRDVTETILTDFFYEKIKKLRTVIRTENCYKV